MTFLMKTPALVRVIFIASSTRAFSTGITRSAFRHSIRHEQFGLPNSYALPRQFHHGTMNNMVEGGISEPDTTVVSTCRDKISAALETEDVTVTGAYDDPNGSHISIEVVSEKFEGKRPMQRQQMVYKAIWEEMQGAVHAVDGMICKAPSEV